MDQLFIDISDIDADINDEVVILGVGVDIETISSKCGTIANEIFVGFSRRIIKKAVNFWVYACLFLRLLEMPRSIVFSRVCELLKKRRKYRNLSPIGVISHQNGVVNGVVDCSWFGDGDVKYHMEKV